MHISKEKILLNLKSRIFSRQIHLFEEVSSTQDILRTLIVSGSPEGTIVVSETQTKGRGRLDREWVSPEGGLWFSTALIPPFGPETAPQITLIAAISIVQAIADVVCLTASIKWPNDIFINGKKVAGIIGEMSSHQVAIKYIAIGIGINVNISLERLPPCATSLSYETQREISLEELLSSFLSHLDHNYSAFKVSKDLTPFMDSIRRLLLYKDETIEISTDQGMIQGILLDIHTDGRLLIKIGDESKLISSGEIIG